MKERLKDIYWNEKEKNTEDKSGYLHWIGLVFFFFVAYQLFVGVLMPKPFS